MTIQLTLFEVAAPPARWQGPRPSDTSLLILAEVAYLVDSGQDDGIGAPEAGMRERAVDACVNAGLLTRHYVGDSDTEGGPRRLRPTDLGRLALNTHGDDHTRWLTNRTGWAA